MHEDKNEQFWQGLTENKLTVDYSLFILLYKLSNKEINKTFLKTFYTIVVYKCLGKIKVIEIKIKCLWDPF